MPLPLGDHQSRIPDLTSKRSNLLTIATISFKWLLIDNGEGER